MCPRCVNAVFFSAHSFSQVTEAPNDPPVSVVDWESISLLNDDDDAAVEMDLGMESDEEVGIEPPKQKTEGEDFHLEFTYVLICSCVVVWLWLCGCGCLKPICL